MGSISNRFLSGVSWKLQDTSEHKSLVLVFKLLSYTCLFSLSFQSLLMTVWELLNKLLYESLAVLQDIKVNGTKLTYIKIVSKKVLKPFFCERNFHPYVWCFSAKWKEPWSVRLRMRYFWLPVVWSLSYKSLALLLTFPLLVHYSTGKVRF